MTEEAVPSSTKAKKKTALTPDFCEIEGCTWEYKIQRHRIIPGRDGGKYARGNVIALCPNHHYLADNGILGIRELFEIVEQRYESGWPNLTYEPSENEQDATERVEGAERGGSNPAEESSRSNGTSPPDATNGEGSGFANS